MSEQEAYADWKQRRQEAAVPPGFADRVMQSIRSTRPEPASSWLSALALAAGVLLVALLQAGAVGALWVAMGGVAR